MKRPGFVRGAAMALLLALAGGALFALLSPLVATEPLLRALIAALGLAYLLHLLGHGARRAGRASALALWAAVTTASGLLAPLPLYLVLQAGLVWLIRSLAHYSGVVPALMDLALSSLALAAGVAAGAHTKSLFLALWCFFFVQALSTAIPSALSAGRAQARGRAADEDDPFRRARRNAEAALSRLSTHR